MWVGHFGKTIAAKYRIDQATGVIPDHSASYRAGTNVPEFQSVEIARMFEQEFLNMKTRNGLDQLCLPKRRTVLYAFVRIAEDYTQYLNETRTPFSEWMKHRIDGRIHRLVHTLCQQRVLEGEDRPQRQIWNRFHIPKRLCRFTHMPLTLKNVAGTFQRAIDVMFATVKWQTALVYLEDILIFPELLEKHIIHFKHVVTILQKAGVTLKLKKCRFCTKVIHYLGHVIRLRWL